MGKLFTIYLIALTVASVIDLMAFSYWQGFGNGEALQEDRIMELYEELYNDLSGYRPLQRPNPYRDVFLSGIVLFFFWLGALGIWISRIPNGEEYTP